MFEHRLHLWEEVGGLELLHGVVSACDADEAKLGAALVPVGDLFNADLLQVVGQRDLVSGGAGSWQDVAAGVSDSAQLARRAEGFGEFDHDPLWGNEIVDGGLENPAFSFRCLQVELCHSLDRWMIDENVAFVGPELVGEAGTVVEDAIALGREPGADVFKEAGQEQVVGGVEEIEAETGFDGWEGG